MFMKYLIYARYVSTCVSILDSSGPSSVFTQTFLGFSLYISNTTDRSQGTLCFKDSNYTSSTIPPVVNITCPVHGQYVIYYNERLANGSYPPDYYYKAYNLLCEVEVYGKNLSYSGLVNILKSFLTVNFTLKPFTRSKYI